MRKTQEKEPVSVGRSASPSPHVQYSRCSCWRRWRRASDERRSEKAALPFNVVSRSGGSASERTPPGCPQGGTPAFRSLRPPPDIRPSPWLHQYTAPRGAQWPLTGFDKRKGPIYEAPDPFWLGRRSGAPAPDIEEVATLGDRGHHTAALDASSALPTNGIAN
jgi:hypothetical protein